MRFTFNIGKNVQNIVENWTAFANASDEIMEQSIYPGAGLIADELRNAIEALPIIDKVQDTGGKLGSRDYTPPKTKAPKNAPKGVTKLEKEGLLEWAKGTGMGLAPIRNDKNFINTKAGFAGYNQHKTKKWPGGHPNVLVARSVESGTSFRQKTPFISPTVRRFRHQAEELMAKEFDKQIAKYGVQNKTTV